MVASRAGRRGLLVGIAVIVLAVAVVGVVASLDESPTKRASVRIDGDKTAHAKQLVLAALGATVGSGSYDMEFTFHSTPATRDVDPCRATVGAETRVRDSSASASGAVLCSSSSQAVDVTGRGTVNVEPYAMVLVTDVSDLGPVTLHVNGTSVWEEGGADYGTGSTPGTPPGSGRPLSGFAFLVEGTLGQGQGALTMISLATHTGYLNLEQEAVVDAAPAGTGTVDVGRLADAANLTDDERATIDAAYAVLQDVGYTGTTEKIGVDDAGFIRDVTATTEFADGSAMVRHTLFSHFGCAAKVTMPNEPEAPATTTPCTTPTPTTSTIAPSVTTTAPPSTTSTTVPAPSPSAPTTTELPTTAPTEPATTVTRSS